MKKAQRGHNSEVDLVSNSEFLGLYSYSFSYFCSYYCSNFYYQIFIHIPKIFPSKERHDLFSFLFFLFFLLILFFLFLFYFIACILVFGKVVTEITLMTVTTTKRRSRMTTGTISCFITVITGMTRSAYIAGHTITFLSLFWPTTSALLLLPLFL